MQLEKIMRPLNSDDLTEAYRLTNESRKTLASPIVEELRSLEAPGGRDPAGIPYVGRSQFEPYLDGRTIRELGATYVELRSLNCQHALIDELEVARGIPSELLLDEGHSLTADGEQAQTAQVILDDR